nr:hypothetical protein [uncultured Actinoplanes sp.]
MYRSLGRRLSFGAAAAVAAIAFAAPAYAAAPTVDVVLPDVTVAAGAGIQVAPILYADQESRLSNATMTFELSGDLGGARLEHPDEFDVCESVSPTKLTCTMPFEIGVGPDGVIGYFQAGLTAPKTALGKTGKITATFTADGVAKVTTSAQVNVAGGVDLAAGEGSEISVKVGADFDAKLQVRNNSDEVVHGAAIIFNTDYAFSSPKQFSNCWYGGGSVNACSFDQELQPGSTYEVSVPYRLRADTAAPGSEYGQFEWLTGDDYQDLLTFLHDNGYDGPGDEGKGAKLGLTSLSAARAVKQTDVNPENNWQDLRVNALGKQGTDFVALGATAKGAKGDTVTLPVGTRNNGPATVDRNRAGESAATVIVTIPAKTKVVTVPEDCVKADDGSLTTNRKAVQYACFSSPLFPAKTTVLWKFGVKLTDDVTNAKGLVEVNPPCECDRFAGDINKKNDTAKIVINPVAGGSPDEGSGGQGGGSLPITGPQTALFGGAGAVLVAGGVLGFFLARRRRTRFEA